VAVALALSACASNTSETKPKSGSSSSAVETGNSASALFQRLRKNSAAAKSVRIKGSITNDATTTSKAMTVKVDIAGDRAGKNLQAIVNDGTGAIEILTVGGQTYLKADKAYWTKNGTAAIAKLAAGKYIKVPAASAAGMSDLTVGKLLDQIFAKDISAEGKLNTNVTKTVVNGIPAYLMTTKADATKIYVSADGQTRLLRVEGPTGKLGSLDFTEWDAVAPVSAPPANQLATVPGL
jgi:phage tail sheath protein FI